MANSDKNIVIQPSIGSTVDQPSITFTGAGNSSITLKVLDDAEGTLSFEGYEGQVFAINNNLSSGVIYSVNDISGFPIIDADASGNVRLSVYSGNVGIGTTLATAKLDVNGTVKATSFSGDGSALTGIQGGAAISTETSNQAQYIPYATSFGSTTGLGATTLLVYNPSITSLGIGTTNPQANLHVISDVLVSGALTATNLVVKSPDNTEIFSITGIASTSSDTVFEIFDSSDEKIVDIKIDGNILFSPTGIGSVGIGTTNPEYDLDIGGFANAADPKNAGVGTVRVAAQLGIGHTDLTRTTAKPTSTYGGVLTLGGDYSTGDNPIIVFDAYPTSSSFNNILIGDHYTGNSLSGGNGNVFLGGDAGRNVTGNYNIAVGPQAMNDSTISGSHNYGIGYRTLFAGSGTGNVALGREAGNDFGSGAASYNIFLGYGAGNNSTGAPAAGDYDNNIIIGSGYSNDGFFAPKGGDKQLAIGGHLSGADPFYWIVGDENLNIGIGTTNPSGAADSNNTTILNAGIVTANFYYGDGSGLINLPSSGGGGVRGPDFNVGVTSILTYSLTGIGNTILQFPATAGKRYILRSINAANVATGNTDVNVIGAFVFDTPPISPYTVDKSYFAYNIPIPTGTSIELLRQPQIMNPSDKIEMRGTDIDRNGIDGAVEVYISYETQDDTNLFGVGAGGVGIGSTVLTDPIGIYTSSTNQSLIQSIRLANRTDISGFTVSVRVSGAGATTYWVDDLIIPKYASVEIMDNPKPVAANDTIQLIVDDSDAIDVQISGITIV